MRKILPILLLLAIGATVKAADYSFSTPGTMLTGDGRYVDAGTYFISSVVVTQTGNLDSVILRVSTNGNAAQSAYAVLYNGTAGDITTYVAASSIVTVPNTYTPAAVKFAFTGVSIAAGTYYIGYYNAGANSARCQLTSDNATRAGYLSSTFPPPSPFPNGSEYQSQGVANCFATAWVSSGTPPPTGSCCLPDGSCVSGVTSASCSGTWTLGGSCTPNPCPQPSNPVAGVNVLKGAVYLGGVYGRPTVNTTFPLTVSSNSRYLQTASGFPFFINGDAAWSLTSQLSYTEAYQYLQDRAARNFNLVMVNLVEKYYADHAPANYHSVAPFSNVNDFSTVNSAYFALVDSMIQVAYTLNMVVLVDPMYEGNAGTSPAYQEGWHDNWLAQSTAQMKAWGTYVGNRYKNYPNIVWLVGGDAIPSTSGSQSRIDSFVVGLQAADNIYTGRLITGHAQLGHQRSYYPESWLRMDGVYNYDNTTTISTAQAAYAATPTMPAFFLEGRYEASGFAPSDQYLRAQGYWSVLTGACGHIFGNNPMWYFGATSGGGGVWQSALGTSATQSMTYMRNLFVSRHWYYFVPDNTVITAGALTGANQAVAARTSDATCLIAYLPTQRQVTINASSVQGATVNTYWYNPATGATTTIGVGVTKTSSMSFTPPSAQDWVLVIDWVGTGNPVGQ